MGFYWLNVLLMFYFRLWYVGGEMNEDTLALLKLARKRSGLPLDFWADLTEGLDYKSLEILVGRSSIFPKYMNSSDNP